MIFDSSEATNGLAAKIENPIRDTFGIEAPVLTKTTAELADIVQRNPFEKTSGGNGLLTGSHKSQCQKHSGQPLNGIGEKLFKNWEHFLGKSPIVFRAD